MGYVYLPIILLIIGIFVLVEWNYHNIALLQDEHARPTVSGMMTSSTSLQ